MPEVSFRAEIGFEADLMQGLIDGRIDIGVMYAPQRRPRLELLPLLDERLVLVASRAPAEAAPYIYIDWGPEFYAQHSASYPDAPGPALSVNVGWLGLRYLPVRGGSGYFPLRMIGRMIGNGRRVRVADAPEFLLRLGWSVPRTGTGG